MAENDKYIWGERPLEPEKCYLFQIGPLDLWITHVGNEWQTASRRDVKNLERLDILEDTSPPNDVEWKRWIIGEEAAHLKIVPVMPDRPIVVRPDVPVSLEPGQHATFFVSVPVFIKISAGKKEKAIHEVPSVILSNSWFGDMETGELCYALKTNAHLKFEHLTPAPYRVVCPVQIRNQHVEQLDFRRLCLRSQFLSIYQGGTHLWTNMSKVAYHGEENWSKISHDPTPPDFDEAKSLLGGARAAKSKGVFLKTFDSFSHFPKFH